MKKQKDTRPNRLVAIQGKCRDCGSSIWLIHTESGAPVKLATEQLDVLAELKAKLLQLRTYRAWRHSDTFQITVRNLTEIKTTRKEEVVVLADHKCQHDFTLEYPDYFVRNSYQLSEEPQF